MLLLLLLPASEGRRPAAALAPLPAPAPRSVARARFSEDWADSTWSTGMVKNVYTPDTGATRTSLMFRSRAPRNAPHPPPTRGVSGAMPTCSGHDRDMAPVRALVHQGWHALDNAVDDGIQARHPLTLAGGVRGVERISLFRGHDLKS